MERLRQTERAIGLPIPPQFGAGGGQFRMHLFVVFIHLDFIIIRPGIGCLIRDSYGNGLAEGRGARITGNRRQWQGIQKFP